jgi:hypothetical protein
MHRNRWPSRACARRPPATGTWRGPRLSTHGATAGLVAVLLVLTAFSVTAAVTNARASADVEESAAVSEWSQQAERSLEQQEELVDRLAVTPDAELLAEYEETSAATRRAIEAMGSVGGDDHDDPVGEWLRLHTRYEYAVRMLLATAAGNRGIAEEYEDTHVDPHFDAIEDQIQAEAERHWIQAGESLKSMRNVQQVLLVTTPVLFQGGVIVEIGGLTGGFEGGHGPCGALWVSKP